MSAVLQDYQGVVLVSENKNTMTAWQAGSANTSAHRYLFQLCASWIFFLFVIAIEYRYILVPSLIAACFAIYYWNERLKLGTQYLSDHGAYDSDY